jgi:hypothetical protein
MIEYLFRDQIYLGPEASSPKTRFSSKKEIHKNQNESPITAGTDMSVSFTGAHKPRL